MEGLDDEERADWSASAFVNGFLAKQIVGGSDKTKLLGEACRLTLEAWERDSMAMGISDHIAATMEDILRACSVLRMLISYDPSDLTAEMSSDVQWIARLRSAGGEASGACVAVSVQDQPYCNDRLVKLIDFRGALEK